MPILLVIGSSDSSFRNLYLDIVIYITITEERKERISLIIDIFYCSVFSDNCIDLLKNERLIYFPNEIKIQIGRKSIKPINKITSCSSLENQRSSKIKVSIYIDEYIQHDISVLFLIQSRYSIHSWYS